ncbi:MAG: hypothetical protein ACP5HU_08500 [Phycisphaerae bacterium]
MPLVLRSAGGGIASAARLVVCLFLVFGLIAPAPAVAGDELSPRLFFSDEDIPELRERITRRPYASMFAEVQSLADASAGQPYDRYDSGYHARNNAYAYVLTGDSTYAQRALGFCQGLITDDEAWAQDHFKGLTRAMMGLSVAVTYDMCKDAWDESDRQVVSREIKNMGDSLMRSGGAGWPSGPGNNWRAVRYSAAGMCYLSTDEPVTDPDMNVQTAYDQVVTYFKANLSEQENARGWNPEGIGYNIYPATFWAPFNLAVNRADSGKNFLDEVPAVKYTLPSTVTPTLAIDRGDRLGYKPDWSDGSTTWSPQGTAGLMFPNSRDDYVPALKWQYDRLCGAEGDRHWDTDRAGGIYSILYYPDDVEAKNPADVWGLNYVDPVHGMVMYRNAYRDADDVVAMHNAKQRRPSQTHAGPDLNSFRIIGLNTVWVTGDGRYYTDADPRGQTALFPDDPDTWDYHDGTLGELVDYSFASDGSGYSIIDGSSVGTTDHRRRFIADYNEATGAEAVFVVADTSSNGEYWRLSTGGMNTVTTNDDGFVITSPDGHKLIATVLYAGMEDVSWFEPVGAVQVSTSTWSRHWDFPYEGETYDTNTCIDLEAFEGDVLVVMTLVRDGEDAPIVSSEGGGIFRTIHVGDQTYRLTPDGIEIQHMVPEPVSMALLSVGAFGLLAHRQR